MSKAAIRLKIMQQVSVHADGFYPQAERLGTLAAEAIGSDHRAQITNLEHIANNAMKASDVLNYIKKQVGRGKVDGQFGEQLIEMINDQLRGVSQGIADDLDLNDQAEAQRIHIYLIRELVRQLAAHYEWKANA